jgi:ABC-type multidrug transport system fused ATPase/permease subunit
LSGDILAGRLNAVAGPSGSGKTTLLDLLIGLRVPTRGRVLFDGIPLSQFRAASLRHRTAYVSQQAALFRGTVRENVLYGCPSGEPDRLHRALVAAQAAEFVDRLPQQVDTPVGDGHQGLSVGQTQRLLLARALVREPAIILLDEPTSALDEETGSKLIDTLSQIASEGRTVVVATHDPAVIAATDHIVRLENCKTI